MWSYAITTGLITENGQFQGTGYSGHGAGRNAADMAKVPNVGPLPPGKYRIGTAFDDFDHLGPCVMHLEPLPGTEVFGRSGFMVHGNNAKNDASHGCLIAPPGVRQTMKASRDRILEVTP